MRKKSKTYVLYNSPISIIMKKALFLFLLFKVFVCHAQTPTQVVTVPGSTYVYVGSLTQGSSDGGNSQKIIVKILGGSWFADSDGETTFYISNRGGLAINQISLGSNTSGRLTFRAYQNGGNIDFYIVPSSTDYTSFAVTSYTFGYVQSPQFISISTQSTSPTGTDITTSITINPVMVTDPSGNIGIGTPNSHGDKLAVNGTIHAKQINVDLTNWADYVFDKNYMLTPLADVKSYIDHNHHLPEMPSEQEIINKGLNLGEVNKLLTKKVEELTLYLIDLKAEKDSQGALIKKMEQRLSALEKQ